MLMGNTVILKPSQHTPLSAYWMAEAFEKAGFPQGVFNMITGRGGEVGNAMSTHPLIDMISFTGSTTGGITVSQQALNSVKRISLELGGKSPTLSLKERTTIKPFITVSILFSLTPDKLVPPFLAY